MSTMDKQLAELEKLEKVKQMYGWKDDDVMYLAQ